MSTTMKKIISFLLVMLAACSLAVCGKSDRQESPNDSGQMKEQTEKQMVEESEMNESGSKQSEQDGEKKILVAYFSWADNAVQDDIDAMTSPSVKVPGDVAQLASWIGEETGGELFPIQVTEPYPSDWDDCLERANQEKGDGTHPALKAKVENLQDYDTVYLGYPNWWYSCPMAIFSFLEENDLSGKQVYLFCSHGTGGLASSVKDISKAIPDAKISDNVFDVYEEDAASAKDEIVEWIKSTSAN